jgi:hypothetical protein
MAHTKKYKLTEQGHKHMPFLMKDAIVELSWTPNLLYWEEI